MLAKTKSFINEFNISKFGLLCCIGIIIGLFFSRAILSISMMSMFGVSLLNQNIKSTLISFWKEKTWVGFVLYFLVMCITYFWSEDKTFFFQRVQIMLPFLILPFAFHAQNWKSHWVDLIMVVFMLSVFAGSIWSLIQYISNKSAFDIGYSYSKVIPTPFNNDHIRFSIAVVASICFGTALFKSSKEQWKQLLTLGFIGCEVIYLHILSVKTGLLGFYVLAFLLILKLIFTPKHRIKGILFLLSTILLPIIMFFASDTFRNKLYYFQYSWIEMKNKDLQANVSDEGRMISYQYALENIKSNPIIGVGLGDVYHEIDVCFKRDIPNFAGTALLPHNQFLMATMAGGIIGLLVLMIAQLILFLKIRKYNFLYLCIFVLLFFGMMIEPLFETQYGTALYLFLILLVWKQNKLRGTHRRRKH